MHSVKKKYTTRKQYLNEDLSASFGFLNANFDSHGSRARIITKTRLISQIGGKKGALFSLIYFSEALHIYDILHNYAIPQLMPSLYSHRINPKNILSVDKIS